MHRLSILAPLGLACGLFTYPAQAQQAGPANPSAAAQYTAGEHTVASIGAPTDSHPLNTVRDAQERLTVAVLVEGRGPYRFLVDTGSQATMVTRGMSDSLGLASAGPATLVATGSRSTVDTVRVGALAFGERTVTNFTAPVLQREHLGADGILGLDSLQGLRVLLDFRRARIIVGESDEGRQAGTFEIVVRARRKLGQMIITNAEVDGVRTAVIIDTGAYGSIGNMALQRRLRARSQGEGTGVDVNGTEFRTVLGIAGNLQIGPIQLRAVRLGFADSPALSALGFANKPAIILGMDSLRLFDRVAIDFARRQILFDAPRGTPSAPATSDRATRL